MITATNLVKRYGGRAVLDGANIAVGAGECVVLTGDNGSGKTTLLHVLVGLRRADAGEIAWQGTRETLGFMPQQVNLPPAATVGELLRFHARLRGRDVADARRWLERAGLGGTEGRRVAELSGGMQQRLAIVLTLFFDPDLIVMDEPASNLDPRWRATLADWATEQTQRGAAMLVTSQLDEIWGPTTIRKHCTGGQIIDAPTSAPGSPPQRSNAPTLQRSPLQPSNPPPQTASRTTHPTPRVTHHASRATHNAPPTTHHPLRSTFHWDLSQGLRSKFMQVFAAACLLGGSALLLATPAPETLPIVLIQVLLFFGSLLAFLVGWGSGQQARQQGAFLFALPIGRGELVAGKLLGTGSWGLLLLVLFMAPALVRAGMIGTLLPLFGLSLGFLLVCMLAGLGIGLLAAPVSGLLAVMMAWAMTVAGWELLLLLLGGFTWMQRAPGLFVGLLLANPAGAFRVAAMIGLDTVPFDAEGLETGQRVFAHITLVALGVFAAWAVALFAGITRRLGRREW